MQRSLGIPRLTAATSGTLQTFFEVPASYLESTCSLSLMYLRRVSEVLAACFSDLLSLFLGCSQRVFMGSHSVFPWVYTTCLHGSAQRVSGLSATKFWIRPQGETHQITDVIATGFWNCYAAVFFNGDWYSALREEKKKLQENEKKRIYEKKMRTRH